MTARSSVHQHCGRARHLDCSRTGGQRQTALPPKADVHPRSCYVAFVPKGDIRIAADFLIRSPPRRAPSGSGNTAKSRTARHDMKLWVLTARQAHREYRTFARLARHRHVASHQLTKWAGNPQAEPGAAILPCGRGISLGKLLEQTGHLLRRHANASVNHRDLDKLPPLMQG